MSSDPQQRRVLRTLGAAQVLSGTGLAAGVSVGALLAADMFGSDGLAGIPSALFTIGSAAAAVIVGRLSSAHGRRWGLGFGYLAGAVGAALVVVAASANSLVLLLPALLIYGAGTATNMQARYAGADLAHPDHAGRAVSAVLVATTFGAVAGPNLIEQMGDLATRFDLPRLAGPFILAAIAYALAGVVLVAWLRPDPLLLARQRAVTPGIRAEDGPARVAGHQRDEIRRGVMLGGFVMVVAQLVMVAVMTMTPVHMLHHGHDLAAAGLVISLHIAGMYLPSPITGALVDRVGARRVAYASGAVLALAGLLAAVSPPSSLIGLSVALIVLGIGWNLGLLSGTTILSETIPIDARAKTQGTVDLAIAVAGAGGGLGSGIIASSTSYSTLAIVGGVIGLTMIPVVARTLPLSAPTLSSPKPTGSADASASGG